MPKSKTPLIPPVPDGPMMAVLYSARAGFPFPFKALVYFLACHLGESPRDIAKKYLDTPLVDLEKFVAEKLSKKLNIPLATLKFYLKNLRDYQEKNCRDMLGKEYKFCRQKKWRNSKIKKTNLRLYVKHNTKQTLIRWIYEYAEIVRKELPNQPSKNHVEQAREKFAGKIARVIKSRIWTSDHDKSQVIQNAWEMIMLAWSMDEEINERQINQAISVALKTFFKNKKADQKYLVSLESMGSDDNGKRGSWEVWMNAYSMSGSDESEAARFNRKAQPLIFKKLFSDLSLPHKSLCFAGAKIFGFTQKQIFDQWKNWTLKKIFETIRIEIEKKSFAEDEFINSVLDSYDALLSVRLKELVSHETTRNNLGHLLNRQIHKTWLKEYFKLDTKEDPPSQIGHWIQSAGDRLKTWLIDLKHPEVQDLWDDDKDQ